MTALAESHTYVEDKIMTYGLVIKHLFFGSCKHVPVRSKCYSFQNGNSWLFIAFSGGEFLASLVVMEIKDLLKVTKWLCSFGKSSFRPPDYTTLAILSLTNCSLRAGVNGGGGWVCILISTAFIHLSSYQFNYFFNEYQIELGHHAILLLTISVTLDMVINLIELQLLYF